MRLGNSSNTTLLVRLKAEKSQAVFFFLWAAKHIQASCVILFYFFKLIPPKKEKLHI